MARVQLLSKEIQKLFLSGLLREFWRRAQHFMHDEYPVRSTKKQVLLLKPQITTTFYIQKHKEQNVNLI